LFAEKRNFTNLVEAKKVSFPRTQQSGERRMTLLKFRLSKAIVIKILFKLNSCYSTSTREIPRILRKTGFERS
jgi:hypothetical protein